MGNNWTYSVDRPLKKSLSEFDSDEYYFLTNRRFLSQKNYTEEIGLMFSKIMKESINRSSHYFEEKFFTDPLPEKGNFSEISSQNGENLLSFIMPALQNAFSRFYINPPSLFTTDYPPIDHNLRPESVESVKDLYPPNKYKSPRLEIFELCFDSDEFLKFISEKLKNNLNILDNFGHIDHYSKIIDIIIDDYVSSKVKFVQDIKDIKSQLRYLKIKKGLQI